MIRLTAGWIGAVLLTAWLGIALSIGAGVAAADEPPGGEPGSGATAGSDAPSTNVSRSARPTDLKPDGSDEPDRSAGLDEPNRSPGLDEPGLEPTAARAAAGDPGPPADAQPTRPSLRTRITGSADRTDRFDDDAVGSSVPLDDVERTLHGTSSSLASTDAPFPGRPSTRTLEITQHTGLQAAVAQAPVAEAERPPVAEIARPATSPTIINVVGTLFFTALDAVVRFFEGPASVPAGRAVRVSRQPLQIDEATTVDADWYFPTLTEPDKLMYLQHGAFARAGLYNTTAADLSELNNAIVVAPSITTNFFAYDGRQLGGEPMHAAVARLFLGDRRALTASAQLAGWQGALPERFVIAGHSGGGQLAAGAAGYYAQFAPAEDVHDMAGVLLLDTSPVGGAVERGVRKIPWDIPVYSISAAPGPLNTYGGVDEVLARIRPGFVGVQLIGGTHGDSWHTTNPFAELIVGLGTGFPMPQNAAAVNVLIEGWIADWYDGTHDGSYGERGETITIATPAGPAQAYVIPGPTPRLNPIDQIIKALFESAAFLSVFGAGTPV